MNTSSCKLLSGELLNRILNEAENIGISRFCREVGISRAFYYELNKKKIHTKKTINKFNRYFETQDKIKIASEELEKNNILLNISSKLNEITISLNDLRKIVNKEII